MGTVEMLKHLKAMDFARLRHCRGANFCFLNGDAIKAGRRGSINGVIEAFGKQGHAAYPSKAINPVHQIAPLLSALAGKRLDEGDASFELRKWLLPI